MSSGVAVDTSLSSIGPIRTCKKSRAHHLNQLGTSGDRRLLFPSHRFLG